MRRIASALLGTVDLIPSADQMPAEFESSCARLDGPRASPTAALRVWAPQGAQILFVHQVAPTVEDLTARRQVVNPLTRGLPDGCLGRRVAATTTSRFACRPRRVGQEQLAARVQVAVGDEVVAQGLVKATVVQTTTTLTTRINHQWRTTPARPSWPRRSRTASPPRRPATTTTATVEAGPRGPAGQRRPATTRRRPGCARSSISTTPEHRHGAAASRSVDKLDEMALDTASTKTTRIRK